MMKYQSKKLILLGAFVLAMSFSFGQSKGSLFIIGGGGRSPHLLEEMIKTASLGVSGYIVILPMASGIPDESAAFIDSQLTNHCKNLITSFNFTKDQANNQKVWIDSVRNAKLIYITGGDQNRFMDVVRGTLLEDALHESFDNGATIAGTSAGAAVMSQIMITGEERDTADNGKFREIKIDNAVTSEGLGFITTAVIDQHFIKRSRYNRLLSVLADHPDKMVIGIDESTAIIVKGKNAKVIGESQVVVVAAPKHLKVSKTGKPGFKRAKLSILLPGDTFKLK